MAPAIQPLTDMSCYRCLDYPFRLDRGFEDLLRYPSRRFAGDIMDSHQHQLHVWLLHHVPLGAGYSVRVQRWRLRQSEHVGANRQRGPVYPG